MKVEKLNAITAKLLKVSIVLLGIMTAIQIVFIFLAIFGMAEIKIWILCINIILMAVIMAILASELSELEKN